MAQTSEPAPVHCYTNPSFCRQSEYIPEDPTADLPPPPQFQSADDLPPPPPPLQLQLQYNGGQSNPAFQGNTEGRVETRDRYGYLEENRGSMHRRYGSLPVEEHRVVYNQSSRYEYIQDEQRGQLQRRGSSRYEFIPQQQVQQRSAPAVNQDELQMQSCRNNAGRYAVLPDDQDYQDEEPAWNTAKHVSPVSRHINTPQGRYSRVPLQEDPPALPDRNVQELSTSPRNNLATQKLHEILTTPRKPRSRSEERTLSPCRYFQDIR